jgi:hypothetical protein
LMGWTRKGVGVVGAGKAGLIWVTGAAARPGGGGSGFIWAQAFPPVKKQVSRLIITSRLFMRPTSRPMSLNKGTLAGSLLSGWKALI